MFIGRKEPASRFFGPEESGPQNDTADFSIALRRDDDVAAFLARVFQAELDAVD